MQRRSLLKLGLAGTALLAVAGAGVALWTPGWRDGRLSAAARALMAGVAGVVLAGALPDDAAVRRLALQAHLARLETAIAGLPPATRGQLSDLLALLGTAPGRLALSGLADWADAPALHAALQRMRVSSSQTRQQAYHALRDLTNAAWFADAGTWGLLGYPGPVRV